MFGFCQNVEIVHEHHHHFYQHTLPPHLRQGLHSSNNVNSHGPFFHRSNDGEGVVHTSKVYHSRMSYFNKNHKGIEVLSKNEGVSSVHNCNPSPAIKPIAIDPSQQFNHPQLYLSSRQPAIRVINQANQVHMVHFSHAQQSLMHSQRAQNQSAQHIKQMQKSTPAIKINTDSQNSSSRTMRKHINCHQLRQSKLGYKEEGIYQTIKINRILPQMATQLKIPHDGKQRNHSNPMVRSGRDRDSILTKKSRVAARKTEHLLEEAKSIVSRESLENEPMQIEQSIIVSRSMDYFCHVTAQRQLGTCKVYLAKDSEIGLLVCIRLFQHRFEHLSFKEAELYSLINGRQERGVLQLYKTLVEGTGENKNIYFVMQTYEAVLDQFVEKRKMYFRSVHLACAAFLQDFEQQMHETISRLRSYGLLLAERLQTKDIVLTNNRFKLNSLSKLRRAEECFASHPARSIIDHLKHEMCQLIGR